MVGMKIYIRMI